MPLHKTIWHIEMFGGLRVSHNGCEPMVLSRQQTGTLFAYLSLNLNSTHSRESLMALIWPDDDPEDASHKLRQSLYALRRQFGNHATGSGDLFLSTRTTIRLDPSLIVTDVLQFEQAIAAAGRCANIDERTQTLREAADLYRGELLHGFYLEAFEPTRRYLADQHRLALQKLATCYEESGDLEWAIEVSQRVLALDPLMEEAHCNLMRLYAADAQPAAVTRQYQALAAVLKKELNAKPQEATACLMESLRAKAQSGAAAAKDARPVQAPRVVPAGRLPVIDEEPPPTVTEQPVPIQPKRIRPVFALALLTPIVCVLLALQAFGVYPPHSPVKGASFHTAPASPELLAVHPGDMPTKPTIVDSPDNHPVQPAPLHDLTMGTVSSLDGNGHYIASSVSRGNIRKSTDIPAAASGTMLWNVRYKLHAGDKTSEAKAVVTDVQHNIYVTGIVDTTAHDVDFLTIKFDEHGNQIWERRYNGTGNDLDRPAAIALDNRGGVYVTGESDNGKGNGKTRLCGLDFATIKYDAETGKEIWIRRYNGPADGEDRPVRLNVDGTGVYVLGKSWGFGKTGRDGMQYALVKYSFDGAQKWVFRYDGGAGDDEPADMALGSDGSVYVTGQSIERPITGTETDIVTLKISKDGNIIWEDRYGFENLMDDWPCKIGLDRDENVYVVGTGRGPLLTPDRICGGCITIKYSSGGHMLWVHGTSTESDRIERAVTAFVTNTGELAVAGTAHDRDGAPVARVVCRDPNGLVRWSHDLCSLAGDDGVSAASVDEGGVYVCGGLREHNSDVQFYTSRFHAHGSPIWRNYFDAPPCRGHANSIVTNSTRIIAVGQYADERGHDFTVVCYQQ